MEDSSGSILVECLLRKILGPKNQLHSWTTHSYKGLGHLPHGLKGISDPSKRLLLSQLPRLLRGLGRSLGVDTAVIVLVDLDRRDCLEFKGELNTILDSCSPAPTTLFRIAIEEVEAWMLGDREAVMSAYPSAKTRVIDGYVQDSIVGTWEVLTDAVHPGGAARLKKLGYPEIGTLKCE